MSINQISQANTFGQLITAVSAVIAVANNFTDGPQSQTGSTWTFTNANVGLNVLHTLLTSNANVGILNLQTGNITNETVGTSNISVANVTTLNVTNETVQNLFVTTSNTVNANIIHLELTTGNIFSANIQSANITSLITGTLSVVGLTVSTINASFANLTSVVVAGTMQSQAVITTLTTTDNANVRILNTSFANITNETVGTSNISTGNITTLTVGTLNLSTANITGGNATYGVLNVSSANVTTETVANLTAGQINVTFANITSETVGTMNVSSANITTGTMAADPTANSQIATKHYVDTGAGGNLVYKNTFTAKGDLPVGSGVNTFSIITSGVNGQSLIVDTQTASGLRWTNGATGTFRNLSMGTSAADKVANGTQLIVRHVDEILMDDGGVVSGWTDHSVIDITASGVGGLDSGSVLANTWYEVYAIRKRSDGTKNFILHRALDRNVGQNTANTVAWTTGTYASIAANSTVAGANARLAQSFTPNVAGPLTSLEIYGFKTSTPTGNIWLTLEANTAGSPSGTTLSTSRKYDVARLQITTRYAIRFVFDVTANVAAGNSYFWILNSDYPASATSFMNLTYSTTASTGQGGTNVGVPKGNSGVSWADLTPGIGTFIYKAFVEANSTSVTMPAGYDQKCLISYVATDQASKLREYRQCNRTMYMFSSAQWMGWITVTATTAEVPDLTTVIPPIQCEVTFLIITAAGASAYAGIGMFNALDIPASGVESLGYIAGTSGASTVAMPPFPPVYVNQQAIVSRCPGSVCKIYVAGLTF